jgi:mono/diheme cytochrome c family protein
MRDLCLPAILTLSLVRTASADLDLSKLPPAAERPVEFTRDIQPIFAESCYGCHGPEKQKGGLRLDVKAEALRGGDNHAPAIKPGKSAESPLIHFVAGLVPDVVMPQKGDRLTAEQIGLLRAWIDQGASWPDAASTPHATRHRPHWSLKPVIRPPLPPISNLKSQISNPIDAFILAKLADKNLTQSPPADRRTLIRRLYVDLIGLPPTPEEVEQFVNDRRRDAYDQLVERLLNSPHYGERWARHWLDVVRYAETHGFEMNQPRPNAWPYRDYVIRAFNEDKPYDRFILEQLAGDVLGVDEATGFLVAGPWDQVKSPDVVLTANQRADELHDIINTTGTTFLGLTLGCARCHEHKFDPIPQREYYGFKAIFEGVQHGERALKPADFDERTKRVETLKRQLQPIEARLDDFEPLAYPARTRLLDDDTPGGSDVNAPSVTQLVPRLGLEPHKPGSARGQASDPGDALRLPNLGLNYSYWSKVANQDVFTWNAKLAGRYRVWLSWGCGWRTHAEDARYLLDLDGNLETRDDQREIARVDQRKFADGTGDMPGEPLWSAFYDAGVHDLRPESKVVLRGGATEAFVTADLLLFQEALPTTRTASTPSVRSPVSRGKNVERFTPVEAKFLRFTITETTDAEPCMDELEVFAAAESANGAGQPAASARNVALAATGTKATASGTYPNSELHRLEHLNDGRYGNERSWISDTPGKGWVQLEFPQPERIERVVWSRDRSPEPRYSDRVATKYQVEVSLDGQQWQVVASAADRLGRDNRAKVTAVKTVGGLGAQAAAEVAALLQQRQRLEAEIKALSAVSRVYAGDFKPPEPTHRFHRGDPMQKREPVEPGALGVIPVRFELQSRVGFQPAQPPDETRSLVAGEGAGWKPALLSEDQQRRLALARWIADPTNPLTARVMVNRIWQYHFGEGLVSTPSDFGANGARPTHPELLDWLAAEFMDHGWSVKHLHRLIVTSATYRQSAEVKSLNRYMVESGKRASRNADSRFNGSTVQRFNASSTHEARSRGRESAPPSRDQVAPTHVGGYPRGFVASMRGAEAAAAPHTIDANNRLLWRFPARRLEAEALRDAILAVSGNLDRRMGGPGWSPFEPNENYVRVYNPKQQFGPADWRRMVYATAVRQRPDGVFGVFDCPDGGQIAPKRNRSTTPLQALNLLNSGFIVQQARIFAERLEREAGADSAAQVHRAFALAFQREPEPAESSAALDLVRRDGLPALCRALFNANEFVFLF